MENLWQYVISPRNDDLEELLRLHHHEEGEVEESGSRLLIHKRSRNNIIPYGFDFEFLTTKKPFNKRLLQQLENRGYLILRQRKITYK